MANYSEKKPYYQIEGIIALYLLKGFDMRNLKIVLTLLPVIVILMIFSINPKPTQLSSKPLITTSNFAIYDVIKHIGKDKIEVVDIMPFGVDPHSFEPTPKQVVQLEKSQLFFFSGDVLEPWADHLALNAKGIDVSKYVSLIKFDDSDADEEHIDYDEDEHHHHHHGAYDPHYWLDVDNMKHIAQLVTEKLITLDSKNKHFFEENQKAYNKSLDEIDTLYKQNLLTCKKDTIVVTHNAFSYLAQRYDFHVDSLTGLSTEAQPSADDVKRILKEIQDKDIKTVFFENFVNSKTIKTVANDLGLETIDTLQPLGNITGAEATLKLTYIDIMKINLEKIARAMQCN